MSIPTPLLSIYVYAGTHTRTYREPQLQLGSTQRFNHLEPHIPIFDIRKLGTLLVF